MTGHKTGHKGLEKPKEIIVEIEEKIGGELNNFFTAKNAKSRKDLYF